VVCFLILSSSSTICNLTHWACEWALPFFSVIYITSVQFSSVLTAKRVTSVQSNHACKPNGTATFSVCIGTVRVSGLHHGMIEAVSSSLLALKLQKCVVCTFTFWFVGQPDQCMPRNINGYNQKHLKLVGTSSWGKVEKYREGTCRWSDKVCRSPFDGWAASGEC